MTTQADATLVAPDRLEALVTALFVAGGVPEPDAGTIARALVLADLRGVGTHGISRLPVYLERLGRGLVNPAPQLKVIEPTQVCALLDGDNGFGFVTATRAMELAISRAETFGIGMVGVSNSNHFGMAACYLLQAVDAGFAALVFTNASPAMPVWGGREPLLGTSPFAFGAPGEPPIILDMATSVVARGKIRRAAAAGGTIPEGWALDKHGNPTTDAKAGYEGTILPLGGPKGSGLSLMMEVLAGVMTGAAFGGEVRNQYVDFENQPNVGHMMIALKPGIFVEADYAARMADLVARARASTPVDPDNPILMPGEPEARREASGRSKGLAIPAPDLEMLKAQAQSADIDLSHYLQA